LERQLRIAAAVAIAGHAAAALWLPGPNYLPSAGPSPGPKPLTVVLHQPTSVAAASVGVAARSPDKAPIEPRESRSEAKRPGNGDAGIGPQSPNLASGSADPDYVPRGQLTASPRPATAVDIPFPPGVTGLVDLKVQVTLFIDAGGQVQRVRLDTPEVPVSFAQMIQQAFLSARFVPGEVQGLAVPTMMRLEAEFSSLPPR
jgi:hypothetical protein